MPKKRTFNFKAIQGSSSNSKASNATNGDKKTASVNERLSELRKLETKDAAQKKRELAEALSQRSVPPELRPILGQAESAPPKPKRATRSRLSNRIPGPAPPKSWEKPAWTPILALRGGRRSFKRNATTDDDRSKPNELLRFARMTGLEREDHIQKPSSLLHHCLKTAAEQWSLFDKEDLPALTELPLRLRLRLLSYIGFYGPPIDRATLEALTAGSEPVHSLDLSGLAGHGSLSLQRLIKCLRGSTALVFPETNTSTVIDSWDDDTGSEAVMVQQPSFSRFSQLTHLSLSHPPLNASWRDLLALSKITSSVTHLSLAYWGRPTFTPNLTTATVSGQYCKDISAGGSNYYSGIDNDFKEPATILRQLSSNLLRLQWLDLEGCTDWFPAFAQGGDRVWDFPLGEEGIRESWLSTPVVTTIFVQHWKNLQYLNCAQGWQPTVEGVRALPRQTMPEKHREVAEQFLKMYEAFELWKLGSDEKDIYNVEKRKANIWLQIEHQAATTSRRIHETRRLHACKRITIDHGWQEQSPPVH